MDSVSTSVSALSDDWDLPEAAVSAAASQLSAVAYVEATGTIEATGEDLAELREAAGEHFTSDT